MKHEVAHDLPFSLAKKAVNKAFEAYSQRFADYSPTLEWTDDANAKAGFSVKGIKLRGGIRIRPKAIELELDVPFLFRVFKKQALGVIEGEISAWVARAKAGGLGA
ncbi:MAG: polyhydroxyalkanoic acid system family protein [Polyangiaceae bacterium]|nr:polyhydroxyalkanoic acid system family protein [Polyangiaceae bacterium]